jgi:D-glycero-alpha-D-manno-heptose-7-phosphate kinase
MIISRTPFRVSFFGGGTDYPTWYREHGGAVLATSINRYCYLSCRFLPPFFDHRSRVVWSKIERVASNDEIEHPVVRAVLDMMQITEGVEIHHDGDLPSRTGLGSSSAFTVGLLHALHALKGEMISKMEMARSAVHVEQVLLKESVGVQDQIATAFGGFNRVDINPDDSFAVRPMILPPGRLAQLQSHVLMFYTGVSRLSSEVAKESIAQIPKKSPDMHRMRAMVDEASDILTSGSDIVDFGRLLHDAWQIKRSLSAKVAPEFVDDIYIKAQGAGAVGGKLLGAGGGGFMIFFAPPERHAAIIAALDHLLLVPIEFENGGTQIIFYDHEHHSQTALNRRDFVRFGTNGDETKA